MDSPLELIINYDIKKIVSDNLIIRKKVMNILIQYTATLVSHSYNIVGVVTYPHHHYVIYVDKL